MTTPDAKEASDQFRFCKKDKVAEKYFEAVGSKETGNIRKDITNWGCGGCGDFRVMERSQQPCVEGETASFSKLNQVSATAQAIL